ncbi:MAG: hypothetical protein AAF171_01845 [Cyanobacteria bacterium P01_A01_bin.116]
MTIPIPHKLELPTVYGYPNPDRPNAYYYLPRQLQPQRDSAQDPTLNLVSVGSGAYLQLSVHWEAEAFALKALRQRIAEQQMLEKTSVDPSSLLLSFAPVTVQHVSLRLGDGTGNWQELQRAKSSGFPPYTTLFNLQLNAEQHTQVAAALNGRTEFCQISYTVSWQVAVEAVGQVLGDATGAIAQLNSSLQVNPSSDPRTVAYTSLQAALNRGELHLVVSATEGALLSLEESVKTKVLSQTAELLLRFLQDETLIPDATTLTVSASQTQPVATDLKLTTDIATWFAANSGKDLLVPAPSTDSAAADPLSSPSGSVGFSSPESVPTEITVSLNFAATEAPLGLVRVMQGQSQALLAPPGFEAVDLLFDPSDNAIRVETHYSTGGVAYEHSLLAPAVEDVALGPEALGLVKVTVEASALAQAGAKKARVVLRYHPTGQGVADETTLYFRQADWQATWFLISRSPALSGTLEYEWQVTTVSGDLIKHERKSASSPQISLSLPGE